MDIIRCALGLIDRNWLAGCDNIARSSACVSNWKLGVGGLILSCEEKKNSMPPSENSTVCVNSDLTTVFHNSQA